MDLKIRIAKPCPANWADMAGDDRKRFCAECKLHVYNIGSLSAEEVKTLVGPGSCVRLFRRKDGTVITRDCPVGVRAAFRRLVGTAVAGTLLALGTLIWGMDRSGAGRLAQVSPVRAMMDLISSFLPDPTPEIPYWPSPQNHRVQTNHGVQTGKWD